MTSVLKIMPSLGASLHFDAQIEKGMSLDEAYQTIMTWRLYEDPEYMLAFDAEYIERKRTQIIKRIEADERVRRAKGE